ncbi:MAG TPA: SurA N-terminal domain-containing protein, partial [Terriglobales bacterium]
MTANLSHARKVLTAALIAATLLAFSACQKKDAGPDVMARVNGREITRAEVQKYFDNQTAGAPQQPSGEQASSLRLSILRQLIDDE